MEEREKLKREREKMSLKDLSVDNSALSRNYLDSVLSTYETTVELCSKANHYH